MWGEQFINYEYLQSNKLHTHSPSEYPDNESETRVRIQADTDLTRGVQLWDMLLCPAHAHDGGMWDLGEEERRQIMFRVHTSTAAGIWSYWPQFQDPDHWCTYLTTLILFEQDWSFNYLMKCGQGWIEKWLHFSCTGALVPAVLSLWHNRIPKIHCCLPLFPNCPRKNLRFFMHYPSTQCVVIMTKCTSPTSNLSKYAHAHAWAWGEGFCSWFSGLLEG